MVKEKNVYNRILIVANGEDFSPDKIKDLALKSDYIIASDGGYRILADLDIKPDLVMGDLDSVDAAAIDPAIPVQQFPPEKDYSDSQLAIEHALELGAREINLCAATGSYVDHSFANIINLFIFCKEQQKIRLITANASIFTINRKAEFTGLAGRRVSFFPLGEVKNFRLEGFKYIFDTKDITTFRYSLSNVISSPQAGVNFERGLVFCVLFDEGFN